MRATEYGHVEPVLIRRLREGPGCELLLYGTVNAYTLRVVRELGAGQNRALLFALGLDLVRSGLRALPGFDRYEYWHRLCSTMIWREGDAGSEELLEWAEICESLARGQRLGGAA